VALSPAERRQRRDERARERINPDTGQPFRNYNELDTWQRNQKAKAEGFKTRSQKRYQKTAKPLIDEMTTKFPESYRVFLNGAKPSETNARQFKKAFGKQGPATQSDKAARRKASVDSNFWRQWRVEYAGL
jgi:hypothetical protein